jgi:hypothetical protein
MWCNEYWDPNTQRYYHSFSGQECDAKFDGSSGSANSTEDLDVYAWCGGSSSCHQTADTGQCHTGLLPRRRQHRAQRGNRSQRFPSGCRTFTSRASGLGRVARAIIGRAAGPCSGPQTRVDPTCELRRTIGLRVDGAIGGSRSSVPLTVMHAEPLKLLALRCKWHLQRMQL